MCYSKSRPSTPECVKKEILEKQFFTCANSPHKPAKNLYDYVCPRWQYFQGKFDKESGYEFDHIDEYSITGDNSIKNQQALCHDCHKVKTKRFLAEGGKYTSTQLHEWHLAGIERMDYRPESAVARRNRKVNDSLLKESFKMEID